MADRAERAFFNAAGDGRARFKTHVYFQTPNGSFDKSPPHPTGRKPKKLLQSQALPACCTAALNRIVPNYVMHMWMATYDNGLAATHYGPCKISALVADHVLSKSIAGPTTLQRRHRHRASPARAASSRLVPNSRLVQESRLER